MLNEADRLATVKKLGDDSKGDMAKGVGLGVDGCAGVGKGGRKLFNKAVAQSHGNLLAGKADTAVLYFIPVKSSASSFPKRQV